MDDDLRELMSRSLDGDLDDADQAVLERILDDDPELAAELEARRRLRRSVAAAAARMEPPAALDRVMEPLRRGAPAPTPRVRPLYRALAAAAALVLAVTVTLEVAHRHPGPTPTAATVPRGAPFSADNEIFELAPLPTANPNEDRPLGAVDRLLDEQPPDPSPQELQPLDVIGPLSDDGAGKVGERKVEVARSKEVDSLTLGRSQVQDSHATRREADPAGPPRPVAGAVQPGAVAPGAAIEGHDLEAAATTKAGGLESSSGRAGVNRATVIIAGVEVWVGAAQTCPTGARGIEIVVDDGRVTGVIAAAGKVEPGAGPPLCVPEGLIGTTLSGIADGTHFADLLIGSSAR
jgi:hypothetical protein